MTLSCLERQESHRDAVFLFANPWKYLRVLSLHCRFLPPLQIIFISVAFLPCLCSRLEFQGSLGTALTNPHRLPSSPAYICHYVSHILLRFFRTLCCLNKQTQRSSQLQNPQGDTITLQEEPNRFPSMYVSSWLCCTEQSRARAHRVRQACGT